jgi:hypothetical protein
VWRYRCDQCRTTSLPVATRAEVLAARDDHRRRMHGGHIPDGERLLHRRPPPVDDLRPLIALAILVVILVLSWIANAH